MKNKKFARSACIILTALSASTQSFAMNPSKKPLAEVLNEMFTELHKQPETPLFINAIAESLVKFFEQLSEQQQIELNRELDQQLGEKLSVESMSRLLLKFMMKFDVSPSRWKLVEVLRSASFGAINQLPMDERKLLLLKAPARIVVKVIKEILEG